MELKNISISIQPSVSNKINALLRLCRICLAKTDANFISIHSVYSWSQTENCSTESMIENLLKVKMTSEKQQPQRICSKCFNKVRLIYVFRNQCHETNNKLNEFHKLIRNEPSAQQLRVDGALEKLVEICVTTPKIVDTSHSVDVNHERNATLGNLVVENSSNDSIGSPVLDKQYYSDSNDEDIKSENKSLTTRTEESKKELQAGSNVIRNPIDEENLHSDNESNDRLKIRSEQNDDVICSTITDLCALCGLQFENSTEYIRHMRTKHEEGANEKKFKCQYCEKGFRQKSGRNLHHNLHTQEDKFICDLCGKVFLTKISIILHFKYHFGIKKHSCTECDYRFVTPRELRDHIKKKHSAKSIVCTYSNCTATFSSEYHLNIHLRVHDTNHAYVCDICGVATVNKYRLKEHKRIHSGVNKSKCPICFKIFARQRNVVRHMKARHKDQKISK